MGLQEVEDHRTEMCIKSLSTEVGLWRLKVEQLEAKNTRSLANFNALLEQHNEVLAENKELEAELEHYRKRAIEFSNDVKKVEAELSEAKETDKMNVESWMSDNDYSHKQIDRLEAENKRLRALCLRESGVLKEALNRKNNKSMIKVVSDSLAEEALKGN